MLEPIVYITDTTTDLSVLEPCWADRVVARITEHTALDPFNRMERWKRQGHDYIRTIKQRQAVNIPTLLFDLSELYADWRDMPPAVVQFCVRNATFAPRDGIPPHLTTGRSSRAGRV